MTDNDVETNQAGIADAASKSALIKALSAGKAIRNDG